MSPTLAHRRPTMDWTGTRVLDAKAGDPAGWAECGVCGRKIRWVHMLEHCDYHRPIAVGCCCARRLCNGYDAAGAEREFRSRVSRREKFLDRAKWKTSKRNPNNLWRCVRTPGGNNATVTAFLNEAGEYMVFLAASETDKWCDSIGYETQAEAMARAFWLIEKLSAGE